MRASTAQGYPAKGINAWAKLSGLEDATLTKLKRPIEALTAWLAKGKFRHQPVKTLTREHVKLALREATNWSNRTFNNNVSALSTVFIFLEAEKIISDIPTKGIVRKKTKSKKHRNHTPAQFEKVRKIMKDDDPLKPLSLVGT